MQPAPTETAVRLDTWQQGVRALLGVLVLLALTAMFTYAALYTADNTVKRVLAWIIAGLFGLLTVAVLGGARFALRKQWLVFSADGVRRRVSGGREWQLAWVDVAHFCVHRGFDVVDRSRWFWRGKVWSVWLEIVPGPGVPAERFARIAQYQGRFDVAPDAYGLWLGPVREVASALDEAAHAYAGPAYAPLREEGDLRGRALLQRRRRRT